MLSFYESYGRRGSADVEPLTYGSHGFERQSGERSTQGSKDKARHYEIGGETIRDSLRLGFRGDANADFVSAAD